MAATNTAQTFFSTAETARRLGFSETTFRRLLCSMELRPSAIVNGGRQVFSCAWIAQFNRHRVALEHGRKACVAVFGAEDGAAMVAKAQRGMARVSIPCQPIPQNPLVCELPQIIAGHGVHSPTI